MKEARSDPALPTLTLDVMVNVLRRAANPGEVGNYLTEELRELTGARTVMLLQCSHEAGEERHRAVSVNPKRRRELVEWPEVVRLVGLGHSLSETTVWRPGEKEGAESILAHLGFGASIAVPLKIGPTPVGVMLLLDLMEERHVRTVAEALDMLSTLIALVLHSSFLYSEQEKIVLERTRQLRESEAAERQFSLQLKALNELGGELSKAESVDDLCRLAVEFGRSRLGFDRLSIWLVDPDDPGYITGTWGVDETGRLRDERGRRIPIAADPTIPSVLLEQKRFVLLRNMRLLDDNVEEVGKGDHFVASMWLGDGAVGYLSVDNLLRGQPITERQCEVLVLYASALGHLCTRKRADEALRDSEERFRSTFEQAAVGICHVAPEGRILRVNERFCKIVGYTREEMMALTFQEITYPEDLEADLNNLRRLLGGEVPTFSMEKRYIRKDGSIVWVNLTVSAVREASGEAKYLIGVVEDISERKKTEKALRESEEQFRQAQKMEAVGRLAGGIAHDFNNLLTAIGGYAELGGHTPHLDKDLQQCFTEIGKASDRAANLTRQLLAFSRRQPLAPRVLDFNSILLEMDKMLRRLIGEDIELVTLPEETLWPVRVDPGQLEQVIVNLAVNARDAMPEGGKLTLETRNVHLDEDQAATHMEVTPGNYAMMAVSDTGFGMTDEIKARLFEPFFTTKETGKGTGLGLATCYGIVKQSGGHIWFYSEPGQGTTFKIYFPRVEESAGVLPSRDASGYLPRGDETILLVEDDPSVRAFAARTLRTHGYAVLEAANGEEALRVAQKEEVGAIHLLLTDVVMPQMGGKELAVKLEEGQSSLKVLFTSGYTDDAIVHHGVLDPGIAFLQKPFSPSALVRKIREVLDRDR